MLTLTNVIAPVRGFDPDSREAERERKREAAIERLTDEIHTWSVAELFAAMPRHQQWALEELLSEAAAHIHNTRENNPCHP